MILVVHIHNDVHFDSFSIKHVPKMRRTLSKIGLTDVNVSQMVGLPFNGIKKLKHKEQLPLVKMK